MSRTAKEQENVEQQVAEQVEPKVTPKSTPVVKSYKETKIIIRTIGAVARVPEVFTVDLVENYVNSFLKEGWELYSFQYLNQTQDGNWRFVWYLVR